MHGLSPHRSLAAGLIAGAGVLLAGCAHSANSAGTAKSAVAAGDLKVQAAGLQLSGGGNARGYVSLHNGGTQQIRVQAVTSPLAASVTWTTARQRLDPGDLFVAGAPCEDSPALATQAQQAASAMRPLLVNPGATLTLNEHSGAFLLHGLPASVHRGQSVPLTIYLSGGRVVQTALAVR